MSVCACSGSVWGKGGNYCAQGRESLRGLAVMKNFFFGIRFDIEAPPPTSPRDPFPLRLALQRELISNYGVARGAGGCACRRFVIGAKGCACVCDGG